MSELERKKEGQRPPALYIPIDYCPFGVHRNHCVDGRLRLTLY